jgi:hypothetical protein
MNYKIVVVDKDFGMELPQQMDYFPNAKDFAVRDAEHRKFGERVDVVSTSTGITVGSAFRPQPGSAVVWQTKVVYK